MIASVSWRSSVLTNINDNKYTSGSPKYYPYIYFQAALRRKCRAFFFVAKIRKLAVFNGIT